MSLVLTRSPADASWIDFVPVRLARLWLPVALEFSASAAFD
jgi:hypothetical protein